jgi:hypothetical protein
LSSITPDLSAESPTNYVGFLIFTANPDKIEMHANPEKLGFALPKKPRNPKNPRKPRKRFFLGSTGSFTFDALSGTKTSSDNKENSDSIARFARY